MQIYLARGLFEYNWNGLEYYGDNKDKTAVDIDLCSEDVPSLMRASPFTANEVCHEV